MRPLSRGDIFDQRYLLDAMLGEGGFAVVWLATELTSGRRLALKLLNHELPTGYTAPTRARFEREVQILARLRDPHTVRLVTYGECDGTLYLVFEYVAGRDLTDLLAERGRLEPSEVTHIVRQVLASLREAHDAGLVHRDLKPANIRITEHDGDPLVARLLDFGIARATDDSHPSITKTGELVGTPRYMSPEQLTNAPLTPASDLYSLGMIAFELLAGPQALHGARLGDQLVRLRSGHLFSAPELERLGALYAVIQKMTARRIEDRFPSAAAVFAALDGAAASRPSGRENSVPVATNPDSQSPSRAGGLAIVGIAAVVIIATVVIAMSLVSQFSDSSTEPVAQKLPPALLNQPQRATASPDLGANDVGLTDVTDVTDVTVVTDVAEPDHVSEFATVGCGRQPMFNGQDPIDGDLIVLPPNYDPEFAHPTVILLHTDYVPPKNLFEASGFATYAERDRVVVLVPQSGGSLAEQAWRGKEEDNARVRHLYEDISTRFCLDRSRTYLVGHGNGGSIAQSLSCEPWVTATAINSYSPGSNSKSSNVDRRICGTAKPTIWLYPTKSPHIPIDGSQSCNNKRRVSIGQLREILRTRNGCNGPSIETFSHAGSTCQRWACDVRLEFCRIEGGAPWPGTTVEAGHAFNDLLRDVRGKQPCGPDPEPDFPIGERIWQFLMDVPPLTEVAEPL